MSKIQVTELLSKCDEMSQMGMRLWLTPGSSNPYWSWTSQFKYDKVVATPWDFLEAAGYDTFNDDHDYEGHDEEITIEIDPIPYVEV